MAIEGYYTRMGLIDDMFAISTRMQMSPHAGKKTPEIAKLKRLPVKDEKQQAKPERKVISIEERREAREAIAAARKRVPWDASKRGG